MKRKKEGRKEEEGKKEKREKGKQKGKKAQNGEPPAQPEYIIQQLRGQKRRKEREEGKKRKDQGRREGRKEDQQLCSSTSEIPPSRFPSRIILHHWCHKLFLICKYTLKHWSCCHVTMLNMASGQN